MSEWCQNKKCPEKKNQNQIRGSKGAKYYQSNKSASYYFYWCSMGCRDQWWNCLLYTSPSPRDLSTSRMPSSA